ncbi:MAG: pilus (MSHA type) biogenesis protein MshL [Methylophilaceae bacterium]|jgi:general secretion pathway protein D|nr:pilus (MSHA type) biogenesis protein MshL [Methylophilaceae bacterium]
MKRTWLAWFAISVSLTLFGCAHQSKVTPSTGHIDGDASTQTRQATPAAVSDIPKPVKSATYLPPPTPKAKEQTYSVVVNEVPVKEILFALARESNLNIDIHPAIQGRVTLNAVDQTLPAILERLAKQVDLTYKIENNVLNITPDHPVLRTYKIDYVNMSRDTKGFIGAAAEISSTGQSATTGSGGTSVTTSASGGANNSSRTSVTSESQNRFWENLEKNIKELLAETDKEVIITREGTPQSASQQAGAEGIAGAVTAALTPTATTAATTAADAQEREQARAEYKTLFAATVISNREAGVITVRGTNKQHEKVREFIDQVMSSAKRQVLIEATIVEVQLNDGYQAGIDWSRLGNAGASSGFTISERLQLPEGFSGGGLQTRATGTGLVAGYFNPASSLGNIAASIRLLKEFGETKVLSSPKLMVLNNQTAVLKVVDNLVYFTVQSQISQSASGVSGTNLQSVTTTPNTVPVGIVMSVTPQINDSGNVNINVRPTISSLIRYVPDPNPQLDLAKVNYEGIPEIQVREMESLLQISSGNTAVLGGLMQDVIKSDKDKVPGLSSVPGLGRVFTGINDSNKKTELVIFLRPTVITNASLESDELQGYKQYLPSQQLQQSLDESAY